MVQLSVDEDFLLNSNSNATLLAQKYVNKNSFRFSSETYKEFDVNSLFNGRKKIESSIKHNALKPFIAEALPYMSMEQRNYWHSLYSKMFISVLHDYNLQCVLERKQNLPALKEELELYVANLKLIESSNNSAKNDFQAKFLVSNQEWQPIFYVGFGLFNWFSEQADDFKAAPNVFVRDWISELNWHRLYWVWAGGAGGFLGSILELDLFKNLAGRDQASSYLESPDKYLGYASWVFYGARLSLHFALLLKHAVASPFMSDEEQEINYKSRLAMQWEQRKDSMSNDFVWGIINYTSLYWYTSSISPVSGAIGGGLNIVLMLFDYYMAYQKFNEKSLEFKTAEATINKKLLLAKDKLIAGLKKYSFDSIDDVILKRNESLELGLGLEDNNLLKRCQKLIALDRLATTLKQDLTTLTFNWQFEQPKLALTKTLTLAFVVAMALMFAPIFPVIFPALVLSTTALNNLVFIGCVMSVLLTAYESYFDYQMDYEKSLLLSRGVESKLQKLLNQHENLISNKLTDDIKNQLRIMYLENKRLSSELLEHQAQMKLTSTLQIHSLISQFMFPAIVFGSLFVAAPLAIAIISSSIVIAMISRALIIHNYKIDPDQTVKINLTKEECDKPELPFFNQLSDAKELSKIVDNSNKLSFERYSLFSVAASNVQLEGDGFNNQSNEI